MLLRGHTDRHTHSRKVQQVQRSGRQGSDSTERDNPSTRSPGLMRTQISAGLPRGISKSTGSEPALSDIRTPVSTSSASCADERPCMFAKASALFGASGDAVAPRRLCDTA